MYLTKRTRELSPAHQIGNQVRVVKKLKVGTECLLATSVNGGSESNIQLITNSRLPHSSNSTPEKASRLLTIAPSKLPDDPQTSTSSPLLPVAAFNDTRITNSGLEQSDKRNNNVHAHISTPISINGISAGRNHNQDYWEDNLPEDEYPPACLRSIPTLSASDHLSSTNKSGFVFGHSLSLENLIRLTTGPKKKTQFITCKFITLEIKKEKVHFHMPAHLTIVVVHVIQKKEISGNALLVKHATATVRYLRALVQVTRTPCQPYLYRTR